jgi:hypothetical protein
VPPPSPPSAQLFTPPSIAHMGWGCWGSYEPRHATHDTSHNHNPGPISPNRGVRRGPQRPGRSVTLLAQKQQIRNKIITGGTG